MRRFAFICAAAVLLAGICQAGEITRNDLGREVKLKILVDKTMQPTNDWVTEPWMVEEAKETGFNVYVPRRNHDDLHNVKRVAHWCKRQQMFYMPWMRGGRGAGPDVPDAKKMVWADGLVDSLWSPNSDEFWEWTTRYIVEYAKMSGKNDYFVGVFLDYENYVKGSPSPLYDLSYDEVILNKFADAQEINLPDIAPDERKQWLEQEGLHDAFEQFQVNHWRQRCRTLRDAVDRHNPDFRFCVYPAPGTKFIQEAIYPEWSTERAPLILADACTYGRPTRMALQEEALDTNRLRLAERMQTPQEAQINFQYTGGIDPYVRGADPEFSGKNAVVISDVSDGYWVFYEHVEYEGQHPEYFRWFKWANSAIGRADFSAAYEPRQTPPEWGLADYRAFAEADKRLPEVTDTSVALPALTLRRQNWLLLACREGQPVRVGLKNVPVTHYKCSMFWELRDRDTDIVKEGTIDHDSEALIEFTPKYSGLYILSAKAGYCSFTVSDANVPVGLFAGGDGLSVIGSAGPLYFHVPAGVEEFEIFFHGKRMETLRVDVMNPEGEQAATAQTVPYGEQTLTVPVGEHDDAVWSLRIGKADEGRMEDWWLSLGSEVPPVLSLTPEHVFRITSAQ